MSADDEKRARLNCIHHLLSQKPRHEIKRPLTELPKCIRHDGYRHQKVPGAIDVPQLY